MSYISKKGINIDFESIHRILYSHGNCCISRKDAMKHLNDIKEYLHNYHNMQVKLEVVGGSINQNKFPQEATYVLEEIR